MIESALKQFEQDILFKVVKKEIDDAFYGTNTPSYTETTVKACVVPHDYTIGKFDGNEGITKYGMIDVYVKDLVLKRDDLVYYSGKDYIVIECSEWKSTFGDFYVYVCQI
jgi:hypothetical protein